jgi:hypothetical protein
MDTLWHAIDKDGRVGVFESGEEGMVPEGIQFGQSSGMLEQLRIALGLAAKDDDEFLDHALVSRGLYWYAFEDYTAFGLYRRSQAPASALHVDQLPPQLRKFLKGIQLVEVSFAETESIQPVEHVACVFWGEGVAYLASDDMTVRPVPGKETMFPEYCRRHLDRYPRDATLYRFEGMENQERDHDD